MNDEFKRNMYFFFNNKQMYLIHLKRKRKRINMCLPYKAM